MCRQRRPKKGSYDAKFVKDFLMNDGNNGKNNTPTEVLMLPAGKTNFQKAEDRACPISPTIYYGTHPISQFSLCFCSFLWLWSMYRGCGRIFQNTLNSSISVVLTLRGVSASNFKKNLFFGFQTLNQFS